MPCTIGIIKVIKGNEKDEENIQAYERNIS